MKHRWREGDRERKRENGKKLDRKERMNKVKEKSFRGEMKWQIRQRMLHLTHVKFLKAWNIYSMCCMNDQSKHKLPITHHI